MDMTESRVLCAASAYEQKYYFNKAFDRIPDDIKDQLHIICVLFTEDIGGIILFEFDEEGHLHMNLTRRGISISGLRRRLPITTMTRSEQPWR